MRKLLLLFFIYALPANANIVPNFTTGTMSSTTNTQTTITESITSKDYKTGYEYTVTGTGISADGDISPDAVNVTGTVGGQSYTWKGADLTTKPNWQLTTQGGAFQFTEVYQQPSMSRITDLTRTIQSESVTETTTIFSQ